MPPNGKSENPVADVTLAKIDGGLYRAIWGRDGSVYIDEWTRNSWKPGGASADEFMIYVPASDKFMTEIGLSPSHIAALREDEREWPSPRP
jgi:hypothetical protein